MKISKFVILPLFLLLFLTACGSSTGSESESARSIMKDFENATSYKVKITMINHPEYGTATVNIDKEDNKAKIVEGYIITYEEHLGTTFNEYKMGIGGTYSKVEKDMSYSKDITDTLDIFEFSTYTYEKNDVGFYVVKNATDKEQRLRIRIADNKLQAIYIDLAKDEEQYTLQYNFYDIGSTTVELPIS